MRAKHVIPILVIVVFIAFFLFFSTPSASHTDQPHVIINDHVITVELVSTFEEKQKGLMYRESLDKDAGMLFLYDDEQALVYWMKNTLIPLDMIFLSADQTIIHIAENVPPCEPLESNDCPGYGPTEEGQYVLEVNGGYAEAHDIEVGDQVEFQFDVEEEN